MIETIGNVVGATVCSVAVVASWLWLRSLRRASELERRVACANRRVDSELTRVMKSETNLEAERSRVHSIRLAMAEILGLDQFDDQTDLLQLMKAAFESSVDGVSELMQENESLRAKIIAEACTPAPKDRASVTMPKNLAEGLAMGTHEVRAVATSPVTSGVEAMGQAQRAHRAAGGRVEQPVHYAPGAVVDKMAQSKIDPGVLCHYDLVERRSGSVLELRRRVREGEDLTNIVHGFGCCEAEAWPLTLNRITNVELKGKV